MSRVNFKARATVEGARALDRQMAMNGLTGKEGAGLNSALERVLDTDQRHKTFNIFRNRVSALAIWPAAFAALDAGNSDLFTRTSAMLLREGILDKAIEMDKVISHRKVLIERGLTTLPDPAKANAVMDRAKQELNGFVP